jgi:hypothetical protein
VSHNQKSMQKLANLIAQRGFGSVDTNALSSTRLANTSSIRHLKTSGSLNHGTLATVQEIKNHHKE